jgi:light-regulated signal transduction histidine kinase (bacteriophytochrome)
VQDVTEKTQAELQIHRLNVELEERVRERTAKLEAANKELETFNYTVAHDLKAPLRGIEGYSQLLLEEYAGKLDDTGRQFLANVRSATLQMNDLINDLLAYSRLERRDMQAGKVNPQELIEALLAECADEIRTRGVAVTMAVSCTSVTADRDGLAMALRNFLENALKFTRDVAKPAIEIGGRDAGAACIFSVRDNGIGFDMKHHEQIFAIFQRLHRSEDYPGTGVGLAIAKKAMERMGGRAWAESEPGKGATFFLEIPE